VAELLPRVYVIECPERSCLMPSVAVFMMPCVAVAVFMMPCVARFEMFDTTAQLDSY